MFYSHLEEILNIKIPLRAVTGPDTWIFMPGLTRSGRQLIGWVSMASTV